MRFCKTPREGKPGTQGKGFCRNPMPEKPVTKERGFCKPPRLVRHDFGEEGS